jgi:hypothetical protein
MNRILLLLSLFNFCYCQKAEDYLTCNGEKYFTKFGQNLYIYWPESKYWPISCAYLIKSPPDTFITATIYHNISGKEPSCPVQRLWVSRDGNYDFKGSSIFCGLRMKNPLQINSISNEMTLSVTSSTRSGTVQIVLQFTKLTQKNCDCSWSPQTRIISGKSVTKNQFIGHVAFIKLSNIFNETFCGGTISNQLMC